MRAVVIGASGGIGGALTERLAADPRIGEVIACSRQGEGQAHPNITHQRLDLEDEASIEAAAKGIGNKPLDLVIIATGILHNGVDLGPEKTFRRIDAEAMARVYRINTIGPALIGKHLLPKLANDRKSVFTALSARVGSISDNRLGGWHAYRASKAALNMIIRNFAIELSRRNAGACCIGLHPGTVDTGLSEPFQSGVAKGKLFDADHAADCLLKVVDKATPDISGRQLAWNGEIIPD